MSFFRTFVLLLIAITLVSSEVAQVAITATQDQGGKVTVHGESNLPAGVSVVIHAVEFVPGGESAIEGGVNLFEYCETDEKGTFKIDDFPITRVGGVYRVVSRINLKSMRNKKNVRIPRFKEQLFDPADRELNTYGKASVFIVVNGQEGILSQIERLDAEMVKYQKIIKKFDKLWNELRSLEGVSTPLLLLDFQNEVYPPLRNELISLIQPAVNGNDRSSRSLARELSECIPYFDRCVSLKISGHSQLEKCYKQLLDKYTEARKSAIDLMLLQSSQLKSMVGSPSTAED